MKTKMTVSKSLIPIVGLLMLVQAHCLADEYINKLTDPTRKGVPVHLKKNDIISTKETFKPPVDIEVEAKTMNRNLRLAYASDQLIFAWENDLSDLVLNGGPAGKVHKKGAGVIPSKQYVNIRWLVTKEKQQIFVDGQLRFEHAGDYSKIEKPVIIMSTDSELFVKSIKVKKL